MTAVGADWAPMVADLWVRLVNAAPAAAAVRDHLQARALVEEAFKGWHHDVVMAPEAGPQFIAPIATAKPLPVLEMTKREIVGGDKTKGLAPEIIEIVDHLVGTPDVDCYVTSEGDEAEPPLALGVAAQQLGIASEGATDSRFRRAALELEFRFVEAWPALENLRRAAERLIDATADLPSGPGPITATTRGRDALAVGSQAAQAWRLAGLPLGGPGKSDEGFADFLRELHHATTGIEKVPGEGALLAELRKSPRAPGFR